MDMSAAEWALVIFLSCIIVTTVVGNTLVILAVATTRRLRTVTNYFIVSLAISDLLVGLLVMPIAVVQEVTGSWVLGRIVCEMWVSLDVLLCTASILNLCCISLDRYFAITSPLTYVLKRSGRLALVMVAAAWVLSAVITCPPFFGWHELNRENASDCTYNRDKGYVVYSALGSFYIPAVLIIYVYWRIFAAAHKRQTVLIQEKKSKGQTQDSSSSGTYDCEVVGTRVTLTKKSETTVTTTEMFPERARTWSSKHSNRQSTDETGEIRRGRSSKIKQRNSPLHRKEGYERAAFQRERRVAKSLSIVVGSYVVCWLPFSITYLLTPFCSVCYFPPILEMCLVWLGWVNSTLNPFIYALNNSDFKKAFKRLTIDKCCGQKNSRHDPRSFT